MIDRYNIIISIITIFAIQNVRLWVLRNFFHTEKRLSLTNTKIYFRWIIVVWSLLLYNYISGQWWATLRESSLPNIILFVVYCSSIVSLVYMTEQKGNAYYKQLLIVSVCLFAMIAYSKAFIPMNTVISYVLISVYAEEYMKIHASSGLARQTWLKWYIGRDLIFFALLTWLWFSFIEHIAYIANYIINGETLLRSMHIARWLLTTTIHVVASGIIAYSALKLNNKPWSYRIGTIIWLLAGVAIHAIYNISIYFNQTLMTVIVGIIAFYTLSFLLYQTNIIYQPQKKS